MALDLQASLCTDSHVSNFLQRLLLPFFTRELSARWWEGQRGSRAVWLTLHRLGLDQSSQPLALSYLLIGSSCSDLVTLHPLRSLLSSSMTQACKLHRSRRLLVPWMAFCPSWTSATWQLHLLPKRQLGSETTHLYPGRMEREKFAQTCHQFPTPRTLISVPWLPLCSEMLFTLRRFVFQVSVLPSSSPQSLAALPSASQELRH